MRSQIRMLAQALLERCEGMIGIAHKHKCQEADCGRVWRHTPRAEWSQSQHMEAHLCPNCGARETVIYIGPEEPLDKERGIKAVPMPDMRGDA